MRNKQQLAKGRHADYYVLKHFKGLAVRHVGALFFAFDSFYENMLDSSSQKGVHSSDFSHVHMPFDADTVCSDEFVSPNGNYRDGIQ